VHYLPSIIVICSLFVSSPCGATSVTKKELGKKAIPSGKPKSSDLKTDELKTKSTPTSVKKPSLNSTDSVVSKNSNDVFLRIDVEKRIREKPLSLKKAIKKALVNNPEIALGKLKVNEALLDLKAARADILPKISVEGNALRWDKALNFDMATPTDITVPPDCPLGCLSLMQQLFGSFDLGTIRDQYTSQLSLTVAQPITAAFAMLKIINAKKLGIKVSKIEKELKELKVRYKVEKAYIMMLQARKFVKITEISVNLIKAHIKQVKMFIRAELIGKSELLKIRVSLGNALGEQLKAYSALKLSEALLKMHMGDTSSSIYKLTERYLPPPLKLPLSLDYCYEQAEANRPEFKQLITNIAMIQEGYKASKIMLLPSVAVFATYQHNIGMGAFQPANTWFMGVNFSWTWEWKKKFYKTDMLNSKIRQLSTLLKQVKAGVRLNVNKNWLSARTAIQKIAIARISIKLAKESLRLEQLRFGSKLKTATSLLDSQAKYDGAQIQLANAIYGYYTSLASLKESMGVDN
jgi:outer membrane protein TolC